jgi:pentafunctional AROM polypeptide
MDSRVEETKEKESEDSQSQLQVDQECILLSKDGVDIVKSINKEYNAIEFRVDMFLHKLWSIWTNSDFKPNDLIKNYLGEDVPESQVGSSEIIEENVEFYKDCISRAMGVMRTICDIPIIYTVRTKQDGGFLDTKNNSVFNLYNKLILFGIKDMKCDMVDIEFQHEDNIEGIKELIESCQDTLVIMSKHFIKKENIFFHQQLFYSLKIYDKTFDILKLVSSFDNLDDFNSANKLFQENRFTQPKIHINLGSKLKLTRVLNKYMLPVSCPEISKTETAPGQMSKPEVVEIRDKLSFDSHKIRNYYLIGTPITYSPSPTFHNKVFEMLGMPDHYKKSETDHIDWALYIIEKEETFGCSVTIPLKTELYEHFQDKASEDAKYIKSINTIVKVDGKIRVYNTDWIAIYKLLSAKMWKINDRQDRVLIIGTGGTALAAIYAAIKLDWIPIIYNRKSSVICNVAFMKEIWEYNESPQYCHDLSLFNKINDFSVFNNLVKREDYENIEALTESLLNSDQIGKGIDALVSWIPGVAGFSIPEEIEGVLLKNDRNVIVFDVSYIPKETELLKQATDCNCQTVKGLDMLIEQAWEQAKIFTGISSFTKEMREEVEKEVHEFYNSINL